MKRNALAAPFEGAFAAHTTLSKSAPELEGSHAQPTQANTEVAAIHYREEEAIYISSQADRVTVIFSTVFREEVDHIFGEVFLREFVDARKRPALQNAPQVLFSNRDPPLEIRGMSEIAAKSRSTAKGDIGYITFGIFLRLLFFFLLQFCFPVILILRIGCMRRSLRFSSSEIISTIILNAQRPICTVGCDRGFQSI